MLSATLHATKIVVPDNVRMVLLNLFKNDREKLENVLERGHIFLLNPSALVKIYIGVTKNGNTNFYDGQLLPSQT